VSEKSIRLLTANSTHRKDLKDPHKIGLNSLQLNSNLLHVISNIAAIEFQKLQSAKPEAVRLLS
jgi:hypothetical protein